MFDFLFGDSKEKNAILNWLEEHDTYEYHGYALRYGFERSRNYYENMCSLDELKAEKEHLIEKHNAYEYEKAHPKPKIGETYKVYICGKHVDTLSNVTNVSSNSNGVYFTITNENGTTRMKEYFGTGQLNWTKV